MNRPYHIFNLNLTYFLDRLTLKVLSNFEIIRRQQSCLPNFYYNIYFISRCPARPCHRQLHVVGTEWNYYHFDRKYSCDSLFKMFSR